MTRSGTEVAPYQVRYHPDVAAVDLPKINRDILDRIRRAIERRLLEHPELYSEPLRKTLKTYRKLRVGDYRVVLKVEDRVVTILAICHRRHVYRRARIRNV